MSSFRLSQLLGEFCRSKNIKFDKTHFSANGDGIKCTVEFYKQKYELVITTIKKEGDE